MHRGDQIPLVYRDTLVSDTLLEMSAKGMGMAGILDRDSGDLVGIYTDGDLRRTFEHRADISDARVGDYMTPGCITIGESPIASEALKLMQDKKINALFVTDDNGEVKGALNMHDLIMAGIV